jgi:hypothetical protein
VLNTAAAIERTGITSPAPEDVNHPDGVWFAQESDWRTIAVNLGGIRALRQRHPIYLPKFPRERDDSYALRVQLSSYTPLLARLIRGAAGLILRKPIHLEGGDEDFWKAWRLNVDRCGTTLDDFTKTLLQISLAYGHSSILTDYPRVDARTLAEERRMAASPYLLQVPPWATIGRRQDPRINFGALQQVRIRETAEEAYGAYGLRLVERVRVLWPDRYELWERSETSKGWELRTGGGLDLGEIPLATTYTGKTGTLTSTPPLLDCAELNIAHYQRRTDLTMALVVAAQPILALMGFDEDEDSVALSVNNALKLPIGGDGKYIETSGSSFAALQTELESIKNEITTLGISTLARQQDFQESGLAKGIDRAESNSMLAGILRDLEKSLQQSLGWVAQYAGVQPCEVHIDDDFDHAKLTPQEVTAYLATVTSGVLDKGTVIDALIRGEWLPEGTTVEDIIDAAEEEQAEAQERELEKMVGQAGLEVGKAQALPQPSPRPGQGAAGRLPARTPATA